MSLHAFRNIRTSPRYCSLEDPKNAATSARRLSRRELRFNSDEGTTRDELFREGISMFFPPHGSQLVIHQCDYYSVLIFRVFGENSICQGQIRYHR